MSERPEDIDKVLDALSFLYDEHSDTEHQGSKHPIRTHIAALHKYAMGTRPGGINGFVKETIFTMLAAMRSCVRCMNKHGENAGLSPGEIMLIVQMAAHCNTADFDETRFFQHVRRLTCLDVKDKTLAWVAIVMSNRCDSDRFNKAITQAYAHGATRTEVTDAVLIAEIARITTAMPGYLHAADAIRRHDAGEKSHELIAL